MSKQNKDNITRLKRLCCNYRIQIKAYKYDIKRLKKIIKETIDQEINDEHIIY